MSYLTDNPELMQEVICILAKRAGGSVTITEKDSPGPFILLSRHEPGALHLRLAEDVTEADVLDVQADEDGPVN